MRMGLLFGMCCVWVSFPVLCLASKGAEGTEAWRTISSGELEKLSPDERDEILRQLNAEWLRIQKELEEDKVARDKMREEAKARRLEEWARTDALRSQSVYAIDPLLKKANDVYNDRENRNREEVVSLFEEYLESNPQSPFAPEIYAKMGSMYSYNPNVKRGEELNAAEMREYFRKAHAAYGGKYNSTAAVAYNWLTFAPGTFESRLSYYEWLLHIQTGGTSDDIYGIRSIGECARGFAPEYSTEELQQRLIQVKTADLPGRIRSTEKKIFEDVCQGGPASTYISLSVLAKRYPETELGRQARHQIALFNERTGLYWEALDDVLPPTEGDAQLAAQPQSNTVFVDTAARAREGSAPPAKSSAEPGKQAATLADTSRIDSSTHMPRIVAVIAVCAAVGGGALLYILWRRRAAVRV